MSKIENLLPRATGTSQGDRQVNKLLQNKNKLPGSELLQNLSECCSSLPQIGME